MSQGEIDGTPDGFVDAAFVVGADLRAEPSTLRRQDYLARAVRGGYPEAWHRDSPRRRERFFESYVADLLSRDIKQVADIEKAGDMRRLVSLLAAQTSGLLNVTWLANELAISAPTVRRYIQILETIFLVRLIPSWSANLSTGAIATPKVVFLDSGLAGEFRARGIGAAADLVAEFRAETGRGRVIDPRYRPAKVVFAILPKRGKNGRAPRQITPDSLFPLAQVALANAAKLLNSYGIEVEVIGVAVASMDQAA